MQRVMRIAIKALATAHTPRVEDVEVLSEVAHAAIAEVHEPRDGGIWSIPEIVGTSETHDTVQGGVLVNSISQFLHLVKAKLEKTLWVKRYVCFGSKTVTHSFYYLGSL